MIGTALATIGDASSSTEPVAQTTEIPAEKAEDVVQDSNPSDTSRTVPKDSAADASTGDGHGSADTAA